MNIIGTIIEQAKASAATLIEQGWEGSGSAYDVGTYHGDAEALAERLGRPTTREERVSLEHQIRRILDERMTDHTPGAEQPLVIVGLRGGDASDARSAVAVDLDPGDVRPVEWLALVRADLVAQLAEETGAEVVDADEAGPWDGSCFGDGAGTVRRINGRLTGSGAYAHLSE